MSDFFKCPTCGKNSVIAYYNPANIPLEIEIFQNRGLGRGKGFEKVNVGSIYDLESPWFLDTIIKRIEELYVFYIQEEEEEEAEVDADTDGVGEFDNLAQTEHAPPKDEVDYELELGDRDFKEEDDEATP